MFRKYITAFIIAIVCFGGEINAQKFGHINSAALLLEMSEVKEADKILADFQNGLIQEGEVMVEKFKKNYEKYVVDANEGLLSAVQMAQVESELQKENQTIQKFEQEVAQKIAMKKEELYSPILNKVREALEVIGKENGYTMIFDTSTGVLLHAIESEDVTSILKTKLGI